MRMLLKSEKLTAGRSKVPVAGPADRGARTISNDAKFPVKH
jgi:hypothetical protein